MVGSDEPDIDTAGGPWRPAASGASFVYVFPRPGEDLLKLGMSRDPLQRLGSLHPRWYEFFDLDAGWIARTDRVREARDLELRLARRLAGHGAPAPLTATREAGGSTEWYRGAGVALEHEADSLHAQGYAVQRPLRCWLQPRMREHARQMFHWSETLLQTLVELGGESDEVLSPLEWTLLNGIDALPALGLVLDEFVPPRVVVWRADATRRLGS